MPDGVVSTFEKIPANQTEAAIKLTATTNAPVGKEISFTFLGAAMFKDRNYKHRTGPITIVVSLPETTEPPAKPAATVSAAAVTGSK